VRLGVVILPELRRAELVSTWRRAEELGFDHAWTYDHLAWRSLRDSPWFGAIPTLVAAATATTRIRLGTLVASPNFRHPVSFARELIALDVRRGVDYLKNTQKISKVILFGHSGGGPTTTYYQAVAEKGPSYCQGPNKLTECDSSGPNSVAGLPPADGIILADAHPGNTVNALGHQSVGEKGKTERNGLTPQTVRSPLKRLDL
jgi:hypothetical protein